MSQPTPKLKNKNPVISSYKSVEDLKVLKDWFYNFDEAAKRDNRFRAIQRVKAISSRGRLPHGIEATALLSSVCLDDAKSSQDSNVLQMSYTMALIRFVNGLLDPFQRGTFAIPLHHLAKQLNLPGFFVELRHMGTHESLPSLHMLRIACRRALNWLYENYWCHVEDEEDDDDEDEEEEDIELSEKTQNYIDDIQNNVTSIVSSTQLLNNLKTYKKIRKSNLDTVYKFGDSSSETAIKYNRTVKYIKGVLELEKAQDKEFLSGTEILADHLLFKNFLIYNIDKVSTKEGKLKFNPLLIKLYKPLMQELGLQFEIYLLLKILRSLDDYQSKKTPVSVRSLVYTRLGYFISHPFEAIQLYEWCGFLLEEITQSNDLGKVELSKEVAHEFTAELNLEEKESSKSFARNDLFGLLVHQLGKFVEAKEQQFYLFEEHPDWEPTPFGTFV
ncbi:cell morphogenesis, cytoskeletal regulation and bud formation [Scheffersomyces xylosifermentans]|uniref:cell morphogenesis, cytoskeletal regulation and bud formation n=1 Tax=Scheffersomyces xylosifermentans TaxID=1304137 RepID=UPI00315D0560